MPETNTLYTPQPAPMPVELTDAEKAQADELFESLKETAATAGRDYVIARIPPKFAEHLKAKLDAEFPAPAEEEPAPAEPPPAEPEPAPVP